MESLDGLRNLAAASFGVLCGIAYLLHRIEVAIREHTKAISKHPDPAEKTPY